MIIRSAPGNQKVFNQISNIPRSFREGIKRANLIIGKEITQEAVRTITKDTKTGKGYVLQDKWTGQLRFHRASAPGQSPANFSGALAASIGYIPSTRELIIGAGGSAPNVTLASGQIGFADMVDYAAKLELRMKRPYLKPSIVKKQKDTENYYRQEITRLLLKK